MAIVHALPMAGMARNSRQPWRRPSKNQIDRLIRHGFAPRLDILRAWANKLLAMEADGSPDPPPTVGVNWASNFVKRHPQYKVASSQPLAAVRAHCLDRRHVLDWIDNLERAIRDYGIVDDDIYNVDETGFLSGAVRRGKIITHAGGSSRHASVTQPGVRTWITAVECIRANGTVLPPMIIMPGVQHQGTWYSKDADLPPDWTIATSRKGWVNDTLALDWLHNVFDRHTRSSTRGTHRLLIMDGHGSHNNPAFIIDAWERNIVLMCLPAHSSHLLQPLDVSCFEPLKQFHSRAVDDAARCGNDGYNKTQFLKDMPSIRQKAFSISNIKSAFFNSGIRPCDASIVLDQLTEESRPITPPFDDDFDDADATTLLIETPKTLRQIRHHADALLAALPQLEDAELEGQQRDLPVAMMKLVESCEQQMANAEILGDENAMLVATWTATVSLHSSVSLPISTQKRKDNTRK